MKKRLLGLFTALFLAVVTQTAVGFAVDQTEMIINGAL